MILRRLLLLAGLLLPLLLMGQNPGRIWEDPAFVWAEGRGSGTLEADEAALSELIRLLSGSDALPVDPLVRDKVWQTYRSDVRRCSEMKIFAPGTVIRYLKWSAIPDLFAARWKKVRDLTHFARQALAQDHPGLAARYLAWARTYLESLPPGERALREEVTRLGERIGDTPPASIRLRNVESEIVSIRQALSGGKRSQPAIPVQLSRVTVPPETDPVPAPFPEPLAIRQPVAPLPALASPVSTAALESEPAAGLSGVGADPVCIPVPAPAPSRMSVMALCEIDPVPSPGLLVSYRLGRWAPYLSVRSSFSAAEPAYSGRSDGTTGFGYLWASGRAQDQRRAVSAGTFRLLSSPGRQWNWSVYAGAGYARSTILWEDSKGRWALIEDRSARGILVETGLQSEIRRLTLLSGVSTIGFRKEALMLGVGWAF